MNKLIACPFGERYLLLRPDSDRGMRLSRGFYRELVQADTLDGPPPLWLIDGARRSWNLDLSGTSVRESVIVRKETPLGIGRASYELNLGCNYECEHCYLGLKEFSGLDWVDRERLLYMMRDAGVVWLQLTGGEPMIDRFFPEVYGLAYDLGMMLDILTNGSRLANPRVLELLTARPPHRVTVSVYGATEATYDGLTRRRGSFRAFSKGLHAANEAGVPLDLTLIITRTNAHEESAMQAMADHLGVPARRFATISPTIYGGAETLAMQAPEHLTPRSPFTGCNAGKTFFHVDPHGMASICKVGRDPNVSLLAEGLDGLARLSGIADQLLRRQGGCTGCTLTARCGTCMVLATQYRKADAPLISYCQHGRPKENIA
ncbi:MoaA/NifB/PqqE/SkfB family radical SAM enzyme [Frankia sp. Hr75.2]|nr:MoaA/NifB/PqqE/SkfB family radical SAM enzyme [Frankia sp. Hr75.2]